MSAFARSAFTSLRKFPERLVFSRLLSTTIPLKSEVKIVTESIETPKITIDEKDNVSALTGVPKEQLLSRRVRIFCPSKNAMQSGTFKTNTWQMEFDTRERWESCLVGWTASDDPLGQMRLQFSTKEDAMAFCEKNGWKYYVDEKKSVKLRPKSYGDNFSWNKKTRVSTK